MPVTVKSVVFALVFFLAGIHVANAQGKYVISHYADGQVLFFIKALKLKDDNRQLKMSFDASIPCKSGGTCDTMSLFFSLYSKDPIDTSFVLTFKTAESTVDTIDMQLLYVDKKQNKWHYRLTGSYSAIRFYRAIEKKQIIPFTLLHGESPIHFKTNRKWKKMFEELLVLLITHIPKGNP